MGGVLQTGLRQTLDLDLNLFHPSVQAHCRQFKAFSRGIC